MIDLDAEIEKTEKVVLEFKPVPTYSSEEVEERSEVITFLERKAS